MRFRRARTTEVADDVSRETSPVIPAYVPIPRHARSEDNDDVSRETLPQLVLPRPAHTRVIVVANQKGGVGKTTTAVNLATALAMGGLRVLVADLDPQGNASTALGVDHHEGTRGTYESLLQGKPLDGLVQPSEEAPLLSVLPATVDLAGAELELVSLTGREQRLKTVLTDYLATHPTDYVFLDCPPSLGLLTVNALVAATEMLVPIQCEYYALEGLSQLLRTLDLVRANINPDLALSTIILTMYDSRTNLAQQVAAEVRGHFSRETLHTEIPRSVRIAEAPSFQRTVLTHDPQSAGALAYRWAAQEIAEAAEGNQQPGEKEA